YNPSLARANGMVPSRLEENSRLVARRSQYLQCAMARQACATWIAAGIQDCGRRASLHDNCRGAHESVPSARGAGNLFWLGGAAVEPLTPLECSIESSESHSIGSRERVSQRRASLARARFWPP